MKKLLIIIGVLVTLSLIMVFRANSYNEIQAEPATDLPDVSLDEDAIVDRMSGAIRFRTISHDDRSNFDAPEFLAYRD